MRAGPLVRALLLRGWALAESREEGGKLCAFGGGQRGQETALLFVQDSHGRSLGGAAGVGRLNEEGTPVTGMALTGHVSLGF